MYTNDFHEVLNLLILRTFFALGVKVRYWQLTITQTASKRLSSHIEGESPASQPACFKTELLCAKFKPRKLNASWWTFLIQATALFLAKPQFLVMVKVVVMCNILQNACGLFLPINGLTTWWRYICYEPDKIVILLSRLQTFKVIKLSFSYYAVTNFLF